MKEAGFHGMSAKGFERCSLEVGVRSEFSFMKL